MLANLCKGCFIITFLILASCAPKTDRTETNQNAEFQSYESVYKKCEHLDRFENESLDCMIGAKMPDFEGVALSNELISSKNLNGKVVVLNFWATHCKPCIAEMPGLNDIVKLYKKKEVEFVSIGGNAPVDLNNLLQKHPFDFEVIPDENRSINKEIFKNDWGLPLTIIFDRKGIICKMLCGGMIDEERAREHVKNSIIPEIEKLL